MLTSIEGFRVLVFITLVTHGFADITQLQFYFAEVTLKIPDELGRKSFRSNDPSLVVPHLFVDDIVTVKFTTYMSMNLSIDNVTYSNDGGSDRINLLLDGFEIGSFDTHSYSNWGDYWNEFYGSSVIGDWEFVPPGDHELTFIVDHSDDCYGVELGTLYISVDLYVHESSFWKDPAYKFAEKRPECIQDKTEVPTTTEMAPLSTTPTHSTPTKPTKRIDKTSLATAGRWISSTYPSTVISGLSYSLPSSTSSTVRQVTSSTSAPTDDVTSMTESETSTFVSSSTTMLTEVKRTTLAPGVIVLQQLSYKTKCIDKSNVRIKITRSGLAGVRIIARPSATEPLQLHKQREQLQEIYTCGLDSWQLGKVDGDNREFQHFVPHDIVTFKLENDKLDAAKFPAQILPFVTPIIKITFNISKSIRLKEASTLFVLGLLNLTKDTFVGLQYNTGPMETDFITFSPKRHIMGWSISGLRHGKNEFYLHFDTSTNTIMFDFLKLDITPAEKRKRAVVIANSDKIRIKGIVTSDNFGMVVTTDTTPPIMSVEQAVIFYRFQGAMRFHAVLSIKSTGAISIYHKNAYKVFRSQSITDASQFSFGRESDLGNDGGYISSLNFNTKSFVLTIIYNDGSILIAQLLPTETSTQVVVKSFYTFNKDMSPLQTQTITFHSIHVTDYLAAVNEISDGTNTVNVMGNLTSLDVRNIISFRKTSPSKIFLTSHSLDIYFPSS